MSTLFIQDTTLTAIANAIRTKSGGGEIVPIVEIFKSDNVNTPEDYTPGAPAGTFYQVVKIEGASELLVKLWLELNNTAASNFMMKSGEHEKGTWNYSSADYQRSGASGTVTYEMFSFKDTDAVSLYAYNAGTNANSFGWYVEVEGYDADGNVIGEGSGTPLTYKPGEMPAAILAISGEGGGITPEGNLDIVLNGDYDVTTYASAHVAVPVGIFPVGTLDITQNGNYDCADYQNVYVDVAASGGVEAEEVTLLGYCDYACSGALGTAYIQQFPDKITTTGISSAQNMFYSTKLEKIPFDLNFGATTCNTQNMFANSAELEELPAMNGLYVYNMTNLVNGCNMLREIPDGFTDTWNWVPFNNSTGGCKTPFQYCYSLRHIPEEFLKNFHTKGNGTYNNWMSAMFTSCYNLDAANNLAVRTDITYTSNLMSGMFSECNCIRSITFATNEDGTPKTANWKSQYLDLSTNCGYWFNPNAILSDVAKRGTRLFNSGRTTDKCIYDAETYAALKNDPDAYAYHTSSDAKAAEWSFYNKASAIETINSLPDCSASGGTNTIKFKGIAGSSTDAGAINTMTEAEIAVATAKGWTVTFA